MIAHGITMGELGQEVLVPLHPGDAAFHDRMTVHGTAPNETGKSRQGWALHYTRSRVAAATRRVPLMTWDTVLAETPAMRATS